MIMLVLFGKDLSDDAYGSLNNFWMSVVAGDAPSVLFGNAPNMTLRLGTLDVAGE